jgi:RDD family protein
MGVISRDERALEQLGAARLRGARPDELLDLADVAIEQATAAGDIAGLERIAAELDAAAAAVPGRDDGLRVAAGRARAAVAACAPPPAAERRPGPPAEQAVPAGGRTEAPGLASPMRRFAAFGLDLALLFAGLLLLFSVGVTIARPEVTDWVALVWLVVVMPLYFALYHAFGGPDGGPGATPGQHELGLCVRDARTGERLDLRRALLRSYGGLAAAALVLPALVDLLVLVASRSRYAWHDRIFGSTVVRLPGEERRLAPAAATTTELSDLFAAPGSLWRRGGRLAHARRSELTTPVFLLYAGLVGLATVLVPMLVADSGDPEGLVLWTLLSLAIFVSGIYWTEAVLITAVEAVRIGEHLSTADLLRRASQRLNALTVALVLTLVLFAILSLAATWTFFLALLPLGRFTMVVPAMVLEDTPVLKAFARSWQLTRGKTWRAFGLLLGSGAALGATIGVVLGLAFTTVGEVISGPGLWAYCLGAAFALLVASVPMSLVLVRVGSAWCLFYYDLRRDDAARRLAAATADGGVPRAATG